MECPYCHKEMVDAFIQSTHQVCLLSEPAPFGIPRIAADKIYLTGRRKPAVSVSYCNECKKVIFEIPDL